MDSVYFYIPLFVHLISIVVGFGSVIVIDTFGLLWLLKKIKLETVVRIAAVTQVLIWIGWGGLVLSGIPMILIKGYVDNLTVIKLMSVVILGLNGILLHFTKKNLNLSRDGQVSKLVKFRIAFASTVSQLGWWSAILIGFLHRHWEHTINFPANPWPYVIAIPVILVAMFVAGERFLPMPDNIAEAVSVLRQGGVVVYPTDTAYGLAVDATNVEAVKRLYALKGRKFNNPIHVIFPSFTELNRVVKLNNVAKKLIQKFLPGPLTIVLPLKSKTKSWQLLSAGTGTLGFRMPDHKIVKALVKEFGKPITATSANRSGRATTYDPNRVRSQFRKTKLKPDYYLSGGKLKKVKPSTVLLVVDNKLKLVREGPISFQKIKETIK